MLVNNVAREYKLSRGTVIAAHKAYCLDGWAGMALKPRGRSTGVGRRLNAEQESEVQKLIRDKTPDQIKMPYALWSRTAVMELIEQRFKIKLPVRAVGTYLARWGFTPQKPIKKAYGQHPAEVKAWLAKQQDEIEMFYLPSYSPDLNPGEMLNADLKQAVTTKASARTKGGHYSRRLPVICASYRNHPGM
ncbi:MAG: Transposase [Candidatus Nitrotoga sp. LAW]|nr:MAG: Transposase [Candidatus Nitrotoga sp. LAW]